MGTTKNDKDWYRRTSVDALVNLVYLLNYLRIYAAGLALFNGRMGGFIRRMNDKR